MRPFLEGDRKGPFWLDASCLMMSSCLSEIPPEKAIKPHSIWSMKLILLEFLFLFSLVTPPPPLLLDIFFFSPRCQALNTAV